MAGGPARFHRGASLLLSPHDPSPRPLADKVLDQPELIQAVRRFIGHEPALIEPWNVTEAERDLAVALDVPVNGTDPARRSLATKSGGRRLFAAAGVRTPLGVEHVRSPAEVAAAVSVLRATKPDGSIRCYGATDNLVDERWRERSPAEVRNRLVAAGVGFDAAALEDRVARALREPRSL
ncbi:MAG: hypothetical protein KY454_10860 [Actinobacteria bacterium]|nr:hypothetical protein [Actinomycetota bacterium]MBW3650727.1 hypothetical protein [Actinomycetota bacterium]